MSKEGFFGPAAFLHHKNPPTGWVKFEGPLQPRAFDLNKLNAAENSPWNSSAVLHNNATDVRFWKLAEPMTALARNADGDQLLFIHRGTADLFCDFGHIEVTQGDYVYLPRGTMWRLSPSDDGAQVEGDALRLRTHLDGCPSIHHLFAYTSVADRPENVAETRRNHAERRASSAFRSVFSALVEAIHGPSGLPANQSSRPRVGLQPEARPPARRGEPHRG